MSSTEGPATPPQVVVVAGSGRSGTSSIAGALKIAGLRVPPPEVPGNRSNPRGFFEPRWVVDQQTRLLRRAGVVLTDARPTAFARTREVAEADDVRETIAGWLREQIGHHPRLLVKDPRNNWFLPLWRRAAADAGAESSYLTMLRHPAEVVGSKDTYYKARGAGGTVRHAQTTRVASWLNVALFTEVETRDARRTFVLYNDLLDDWRPVLARVGDELALAGLDDLPDEVASEIDEFVDPGLRRVRTQWDEIDCPDEIREMAQQVWDHLGVLASERGFDEAAQSGLDALRERYTALYLDAEALAQSTAEAAQRAGAHRGRGAVLKQQRRARRKAARARRSRLDRARGEAAGALRRVVRRVRRGRRV